MTENIIKPDGALEAPLGFFDLWEYKESGVRIEIFNVTDVFYNSVFKAIADAIKEFEKTESVNSESELMMLIGSRMPDLKTIQETVFAWYIIGESVRSYIMKRQVLNKMGLAGALIFAQALKEC